MCVVCVYRRRAEGEHWGGTGRTYSSAVELPAAANAVNTLHGMNRKNEINSVCFPRFSYWIFSLLSPPPPLPPGKRTVLKYFLFFLHSGHWFYLLYHLYSVFWWCGGESKRNLLYCGWPGAWRTFKADPRCAVTRAWPTRTGVLQRVLSPSLGFHVKK